LVACSSTSSGTSASSPDSACQSAAEALCAKYDQCFGTLAKALFTDNATCVARSKTSCLTDLNAPNTGATPDQLSQCANDVKAETCDDVLSKEPDSCKDAAGTLADGAACGKNAQCVNKFCRLAEGSKCGSCSKKAAAGGTCEASSECEDDLVCLAGKCATPVAAGGACSDTTPCKAPNRCVNKVCAKPLAVGAACDATNGDPCDRLKGEYCSANKVCTGFVVAEAGQPCGIVNGTATICANNGTCQTSGTSQSGTCLAAAADGAKCDDAKGPACQIPARCVGGVCTLPDPASCK